MKVEKEKVIKFMRENKRLVKNMTPEEIKKFLRKKYNDEQIYNEDVEKFIIILNQTLSDKSKDSEGSER